MRVSGAANEEYLIGAAGNPHREFKGCDQFEEASFGKPNHTVVGGDLLKKIGNRPNRHVLFDRVLNAICCRVAHRS